MFNRFAITTAIAFALAACGGGGSGGSPKTTMNDESKTGNTPMAERPAPQAVRTLGENELLIGRASRSQHVVGSEYIRKPIPAGVTWVTATEYRVYDVVNRSYSPQAAEEDGLLSQSFYYGHWSDRNMMLYFGGWQYDPLTIRRIARFNVSLGNDEIIGSVSGVQPLTKFADSPRIQSQKMVNYGGTLVGFTTSNKQPLGAEVSIQLNLGNDVTGTFDLAGLSTIERDGSLKPFLGGNLHHDIAVTGNTFTTTGGDPGTVTGFFAGETHQAAAGTVQHSAFTGAFGAEPFGSSEPTARAPN